MDEDIWREKVNIELTILIWTEYFEKEQQYFTKFQLNIFKNEH